MNGDMSEKAQGKARQGKAVDATSSPTVDSMDQESNPDKVRDSETPLALQKRAGKIKLRRSPSL